MDKQKMQNEINRRIGAEIKSISRDKKSSLMTRDRLISLDLSHLYEIIGYRKAKIKNDIEKTIADKLVFQEFAVRRYLGDMTAHEFLMKIDIGQRKANIYKKSRSVPKKGDRSKSERLQCNDILSSGIPIGDIKVLDREVPICLHRGDGLGKVDMMGVRGSDMVLIEYKIPISSEPMLRAVLEVLTYFREIGGIQPANSPYLLEFNRFFRQNCTNMKCAIVIPREEYKFGHKTAWAYQEEFGIECYTFSSDDDYKDIVKLTDEELAEYKKCSMERLSEIYAMSDTIFDSINSIL